MKEAFALLNKSIIRVEQPDINLEEEAAEKAEVSAEPEGQEQMEVGQVRVFGICITFLFPPLCFGFASVVY